AAISWRRSINRGVVEIPRTTDQELLGQPGRRIVLHSSAGAGLPGTQVAGGSGERLGTGVHGRTHGRLLVRADRVNGLGQVTGAASPKVKEGVVTKVDASKNIQMVRGMPSRRRSRASH